MNKIKKLAIFALVTVLVFSLQVDAKKKKVKLNGDNISLYVGDSYTLKLKNTKGKVKWSSSKKSVATVSSKGKVRAKKSGTCKITAKVGKKKYTCRVTVKKEKVKKKIIQVIKIMVTPKPLPTEPPKPDITVCPTTNTPVVTATATTKPTLTPTPRPMRPKSTK